MGLFKKKKPEQEYRVLIKDPSGDREEQWVLSEEQASKYVNEQGIAYAIVFEQDGQSKALLCHKKVWENYDDFKLIAENQSLSQEEKKQQMLKLMKELSPA